MAERWNLRFDLHSEDMTKLFHWLVKALQHDPHVASVEVNEHRNVSWVGIVITFIEGYDCPHISTLQSLKHTHGEVLPPTWLERLQRDDTIGV